MSFDYPGTDAMLNKHIAALAYAVDNGDGSYSLRLVTEDDPLPGGGGGGGTIGDVTVTIPDMLEVGGNDSATATLFTTTDTTSYSALSLWLNVASGTTLVAEVSNDGTNWRAIYGEAEDTNAQSNSFTASGLYAFAVRAKQFRVRRTVLGSGTSSALAKFRKDPFQPRNIIGSVSVSGTVDVSGSSVSAAQSGAWTVGITGTAAVTQSGAWTVGISGTAAVTQSGSWTVSITGTPTVNAVQSGAWTVSISGTAAVTQSGTWSTRTQDGAGNAISSTGGALDVNIKTAAALSTSIIRTPRANKGRQRTSITGTAETDITPLGGSGNYLDLFRLVIANEGATDVNVEIRDALAGSTQMSYAVKAGQTVGFSGTETSDQSATNNKWTAQSSAATTLIVTAEWIKNT